METCYYGWNVTVRTTCTHKTSTHNTGTQPKRLNLSTAKTDKSKNSSRFNPFSVQSWASAEQIDKMVITPMSALLDKHQLSWTCSHQKSLNLDHNRNLSHWKLYNNNNRSGRQSMTRLGLGHLLFVKDENHESLPSFLAWFWTNYGP